MLIYILSHVRPASCFCCCVWLIVDKIVQIRVFRNNYYFIIVFVFHGYIFLVADLARLVVTSFSKLVADILSLHHWMSSSLSKISFLLNRLTGIPLVEVSLYINELEIGKPILAINTSACLK